MNLGGHKNSSFRVVHLFFYVEVLAMKAGSIIITAVACLATTTSAQGKKKDSSGGDTPQTKYYCPLDCDSGPSNKFLIKSASTPYKYWSGREGDCNANSPAVSLLSDKSEATTFQSQNLSKGNGDVDYTQFLLPDKQAKGSCPRVPSAYAWPSPDALKEGHLAVTGINDIDDDFELTQFRVYPIDIEDTACEGPVIIRSKEGKKYLSMNKMSDFELKTTNPNKATRWLIDFKSSGQCS